MKLAAAFVCVLAVAIAEPYYPYVGDYGIYSGVNYGLGAGPFSPYGSYGSYPFFSRYIKSEIPANEAAPKSLVKPSSVRAARDVPKSALRPAPLPAGPAVGVPLLPVPIPPPPPSANDTDNTQEEQELGEVLSVPLYLRCGPFNLLACFFPQAFIV